MASLTEIAWAVGLFEGEGCIYRAGGDNGRRGGYYLNLCSTDLDVLEQFQRIIGYGKIRERKRYNKPAHHKDAWSWDLRDTVRVIEVLELMLPMLGDRRGAKAREALESLRLRLATSPGYMHPSEKVA